MVFTYEDTQSLAVIGNFFKILDKLPGIAQQLSAFFIG